MEDQNTKENVETNNNDVKPKVIILEPIIFSFRNKSNIIASFVFFNQAWNDIMSIKSNAK